MSLATSASLNAMPRSILLAKKRIGSFRFLIAETRIQIKYNLHGWSKRFSSSLHATLILNLSAASTTNMIAYHFTFITSLPLIPRSTVPRDCGTCFSRTCQTRWSRFCFCWMSPLWSRLWLLFLFGSTKRVLGEIIIPFSVWACWSLWTCLSCQDPQWLSLISSSPATRPLILYY